jgi:hypothetical protein
MFGRAEPKSVSSREFSERRTINQVFIIVYNFATEAQTVAVPVLISKQTCTWILRVETSSSDNVSNSCELAQERKFDHPTQKPASLRRFVVGRPSVETHLSVLDPPDDTTPWLSLSPL